MFLPLSETWQRNSRWITHLTLIPRIPNSLSRRINMEVNSAISITAKLPQHHSVEYHDIPIIVEWPKGCVREGKDRNGKSWRREMQADYGFIDDTSAAGDTEPLDIYIGPDKNTNRVFVLEQLNESGEFDEYKLVAGVPNLESALNLYLAHYPKG